LTAQAPSGWNTGLAPNPTLSGNSIMTVTVPATSAGSYTVTVTGTSGSLTHTTTVTVNVQAPTLSVTVKTDKTSYSRGQAVSIAVSVTSGGSIIRGASVSVKVANPRGSASTYSATTGSDGKAVVTYRLSSSAQRGTYKVTVTASRAGYQSASATTSFTVS
jgi:uncharacterized membrane protein